MRNLRYIVDIMLPAVEGEDCDLSVKVTLPNGRSKSGVAPFVPLMNQIKSTISEDLEGRL